MGADVGVYSVVGQQLDFALDYTRRLPLLQLAPARPEQKKNKKGGAVAVAGAATEADSSWALEHPSLVCGDARAGWLVSAAAGGVRVRARAVWTAPLRRLPAARAVHARAAGRATRRHQRSGLCRSICCSLGRLAAFAIANASRLVHRPSTPPSATPAPSRRRPCPWRRRAVRCLLRCWLICLPR